MIALAKYFSSVITNGKRIIKSKGIGGTAMTTKECYPFGFDSQALEGWTAVYSSTANRDEDVIVGYINKGQLAGAGESRMYAVGSNGELVGFMWCKADGTLELNGSAYTAVRFAPLNTAIENKDTSINTELEKIALAITSLGGIYTPGTITTSLAPAESQTVKLK